MGEAGGSHSAEWRLETRPKKKKKSGTTQAFRGDILGWNPMNWAMKDEEGTVAEGIALGGGQIKVWMSQGTHRAAQI